MPGRPAANGGASLLGGAGAGSGSSRSGTLGSPPGAGRAAAADGSGPLPGLGSPFDAAAAPSTPASPTSPSALLARGGHTFAGAARGVSMAMGLLGGARLGGQQRAALARQAGDLSKAHLLADRERHFLEDELRVGAGRREAGAGRLSLAAWWERGRVRVGRARLPAWSAHTARRSGYIHLCPRLPALPPSRPCSCATGKWRPCAATRPRASRCWAPRRGQPSRPRTRPARSAASCSETAYRPSSSCAAACCRTQRRRRPRCRPPQRSARRPSRPRSARLAPPPPARRARPRRATPTALLMWQIGWAWRSCLAAQLTSQESQRPSWTGPRCRLEPLATRRPHSLVAGAPPPPPPRPTRGARCSPPPTAAAERPRAASMAAAARLLRSRGSSGGAGLERRTCGCSWRLGMRVGGLAAVQGASAGRAQRVPGGRRLPQLVSRCGAQLTWPVPS